MKTGTTKNKGQKDFLDRFYTPFDEANNIVERLSNIPYLNINNNTVFIEPSAGDGAFVCAIEKFFPQNKIIATDIKPAIAPVCKTPIVEADFLDINLYDIYNQNILSKPKAEKDIVTSNTIIIGNPPFGEQAKTAIAFINKALLYGRYCCFILPPSFQKETIQSKLNGKVVDVFPVKNTAYRVGKDLIDVPSVFIIIDGEQKFSPLPDYSNNLPFIKLSSLKRDEADFAIRRVGGTAGTCIAYNKDLSSETYYFYKKKENCPDNIISLINSCNFPERDWSVGPRSISSKEISKNVYKKLKTTQKTT